jgi:hypothetical protein
MSSRSKSTVKMLCVASNAIMRKELPEEAQKLLDLYNDPDVAPEQKQIVKAELDAAIKVLEDRATTRRLNDEKKNIAGSEPSVP